MGTERPAIQVPACWGESVRLALRGLGLLAADLEPASHQGTLWFPLTANHDPSALAPFLRTHDYARATTHHFAPRHARIANYREHLNALPKEIRAALPTSFDIVGHVAIIKLPEIVQPHRGAIAEALMATHRRIETVAMDAGVQGDLRIRSLEVLAGRDTLDAEHREHGLRLHVPLRDVYFSPRLATERHRVTERMRPGARVLDLFAGVGALVCLVLRDRAPASVHAIDLNPAATRALAENVTRNGLDDAAPRCTIRQGDAREVAPRTGHWDHVVMNLPHGAETFLDVAAACVAPQGEVHVYAMVEKGDEEATGQRMAETLARAHKEAGGHGSWRVGDRRHVRAYAPTMDGLAYTLVADPRPSP